MSEPWQQHDDAPYYNVLRERGHPGGVTGACDSQRRGAAVAMPQHSMQLHAYTSWPYTRRFR